MTAFDFLVVGGGPVGLSAALALTRKGLHGQVIDQAEAMPQRPSTDAIGLRSPRVSAINQSSIQFCEQLGIHSAFFQQNGCRFTDMQVWDAEGSAKLSLPADGVIIENDRLVHRLFDDLDRAVGDGNDPVRWRTGIIDIIPSSTEVRVQLSTGEFLSTALLVGADGGGSKTRDLLGINTLGWSYDQMALVAVVTMDQAHGGTAFQAFTQEGPMALLPLPESNQCVLVWSSRHAAERFEDSDETLLSLINQACEQEAGAALAMRDRQRFPLFQRHARRYVKGSAVLVGDAAHSIHPLAGQGLNLGFGDVMTLSAVLDEMRFAPDISLATALKDYQRQRRRVNLRMTAMTDLTKRLFDPKGAELRWLRNAALRAMDQQTALKQMIGLAGAGFL